MEFSDSPTAEDVKRLGPDCLPFLPLDTINNQTIVNSLDVLGKTDMELSSDVQSSLKTLLLAVSNLLIEDSGF